MRILSNKHNLNIANARYRGYSRDSEYIGYRHTISTRKAIWYHSVSSNEQVHFILVLTHKYFLPSQWAAVLAPTYPLPVPSRLQASSPIWASDASLARPVSLAQTGELARRLGTVRIPDHTAPKCGTESIPYVTLHCPDRCGAFSLR